VEGFHPLYRNVTGGPVKDASVSRSPEACGGHERRKQESAARA
jgi:hypothetical protein